jgi:hypothetical protein
MSRGHGDVQRRVLEQLKLNTADPMNDWDNRFASWTTVQELAGDDATRAQIESTRRAVLKLDDDGLVDVLYVHCPVPAAGRVQYGRPHPRTVNRLVLVARLPLEPELQQQWQAIYEAHREKRRRFRWLQD